VILKANGPSRVRCQLAGKGRSNAPGGGPLLIVGVDRARVETQLVSGGLACPDCGGRLAPWGHGAPRFVREAGEWVRRIRPRRAICSREGGCRRTHVLLPRFCLGRRIDVVAVIWAALLAWATGWGWRRICAAAGRPASTVRGWLTRFAAHAEPIRVGFARLERLAGMGTDMDRLSPAGSPIADAVAQIGAGCAAVRRAVGVGVVEVSVAELVAACSGGWLLGVAAPVVAAMLINM
jgi:hypothetical protein